MTPNCIVVSPLPLHANASDVQCSPEGTVTLKGLDAIVKVIVSWLSLSLFNSPTRVFYVLFSLPYTIGLPCSKICGDNESTLQATAKLPS